MGTRPRLPRFIANFWFAWLVVLVIAIFFGKPIVLFVGPFILGALKVIALLIFGTVAILFLLVYWMCGIGIPMIPLGIMWLIDVRLRKVSDRWLQGFGYSEKFLDGLRNVRMGASSLVLAAYAVWMLPSNFDQALKDRPYDDLNLPDASHFVMGTERMLIALAVCVGLAAIITLAPALPKLHKAIAEKL